MTLIGLIIFLLISAIAGWLFGRWAPSSGGRSRRFDGFRRHRRLFVACKPLR